VIVGQGFQKDRQSHTDRRDWTFAAFVGVND